MEKNKYALKEEEVLKFWQENHIFEKSVSSRPEGKSYVFYDGPPFATGLPHYGHILASTLKDVFPRYQTMKGNRVERRWGWDCHGLPIENIAEKELGIKTKKQIEELGVEKFNEFCRSKVLAYAEEWKGVIARLGRFVDMEHPYKTMDLSFMESVWWVFKQLWDKKLVYEGYRSMHVCPRCETTLSQSEVAEGYKDIKDLSVTAKFHLLPGQKFGDGNETKETSYILAWTTTPWTLLGNVALAVGNEISYTALRVKGVAELLILASDLVEKVMDGKEIEIVHDDIKGSDLVGLKYEPLFEAQSNLDNFENGWKVVQADFVTTEEGTGVVHIAPAFGEDDMNLGKQLDLPFIQHVGMDGVIKEGYGEFTGMSVKPMDDVQSTDVAIIKYLAAKNLLFDKAQYEHSYPHCWRCDTPLINYATSSWFVAVEKIKPEALELAKQINWSPSHIKTGRFGNWLEGARDWSISRQRYWASVIPIWKCDKCSEIKVVGSVADLKELSGQEIDDLHKHVMDKVTFGCQSCEGQMKRIPDVLDTWFDSGSMPYAEFHYPFENKEKFEENFPAEFIGEGIDQTRAWFYYLHILGTALMNKPAFKNSVVNGIVLAEDGKKMSKRLNNYPDPSMIFDQYGADSLRFYLMSSVVMQADNLSFSERDLREVYNKVINTTSNILSFFEIYKDEIEPAIIDKVELSVMDRYVLSRIEGAKMAAYRYLDAYDSVRYCRELRAVIEDISLWWLRRSRERFRAESEDRQVAMGVLLYVLKNLALIMAPVTPFISETIWQGIKQEGDEESVHLALLTKVNEGLIDKKLEAAMERAREIVEIGHSLRQKAGLKVRQPLEKIYYSYDFGEHQKAIAEIILAELNIEKLSGEQDFTEPEKAEAKDLTVVIETKLDERLQDLGDLREITRLIQELRKKSGLRPNAKAKLRFGGDENAVEFTNSNLEKIKQATNLETLEVGAEEGSRLEISRGVLYFSIA